jgi:uncharacterized membrane protein YeaQ/YmgE (transglycosylase-associated protein family)
MNFQTMNKLKKYIFISSVVGIIGMFLPWFRIEFFGFSQSINGLHDWGILIFFSFIGAGILVFVGDQSKNFDRTVWFIELLFGGISTLIMIVLFLKALGNGFGFLSFGFYLTSLAALGVLLSSYFFRNPTDSLKDGFESLKDTIEKKAKSENNN